MDTTVAAMNCATHLQTESVSFCRSCGKALCVDCVRRDVHGVVYCDDCVPAEQVGQVAARPAMDRASYAALPEPASSIPPPPPMRVPQPSVDAPSPFLAFVLGLIPGVGAVYNGHYAKAVFHVVVFGSTVALIGTGELDGLAPLLGLFALMFFIYMPMEAARTAKALRRGEPVDEFSGLLSVVHAGSRSPVVGVVLIAAGIAFLLHSLGYWRFANLAPFILPLTLIGIGVYLLYRRFSEPSWQAGPDYPRRFERPPSEES